MLPYQTVRSSQFNRLVEQGIITSIKSRTDTSMDTLAEKVSNHVAAKLQDASIDIDSLAAKVVDKIMPKLESQITTLLQGFFSNHPSFPIPPLSTPASSDISNQQPATETTEEIDEPMDTTVDEILNQQYVECLRLYFITITDHFI